MLDVAEQTLLTSHRLLILSLASKCSTRIDTALSGIEPAISATRRAWKGRRMIARGIRMKSWMIQTCNVGAALALQRRHQSWRHALLGTKYLPCELHSTTLYAISPLAEAMRSECRRETHGCLIKRSEDLTAYATCILEQSAKERAARPGGHERNWDTEKPHGRPSTINGATFADSRAHTAP